MIFESADNHTSDKTISRNLVGNEVEKVEKFVENSSEYQQLFMYIDLDI